MESIIISQLNNYIDDPLALMNAYDELKHCVQDDSFIALASLLSSKTAHAFEKKKVSTAYFAGLILK